MNDFEKIPFYDENNEQIDFYVLEQTKIAGNDYLLVTDEEGIADAESSEDATVYVMKAVEDGEDSSVVTYEFVNDDDELQAVMQIFEQLMDEIDIITE
ncbi:MAG: DUF1292 domain-containing protein [Lachnospiraceae bacterium]|nr:DUF1292 domain-containing protein [Lachnospiraceae bacterium]